MRQGSLCTSWLRLIRQLKNMPQIVVYYVYKQLQRDFSPSSFDTKGRFDKGLKLLRMLGSREGFFIYLKFTSNLNRSQASLEISCHGKTSEQTFLELFLY